MPKQKNQKKEEQFIPIKLENVKLVTEVPVNEIREEDLITIEKPGKTKLGKKTKKLKIELKTRSIREDVEKSDSEETNKKLKDKYTLIITEKPQAALKIANALGKPRKYSENFVPYYYLERDGKKIIVACAVGHLLNLSGIGKGYPIFETEWLANFKSKKQDWSKKYYNLLVKLCKNANEFIIATDFDIEGEVIGWNIIRFIAKQKDAKRMKYSTLTTNELNESYKNLMPTIEWSQAYAGETRHILDWLYGINLSRALMEAIKKAGSFRIMSIGRVQGPALNFIVEKELEIQKFKSSLYWQIFIKLKGHKPELKYEKDIIKKEELKEFEDLEGKKGVAKTDKAKRNIPPPTPFDLTSLQREAYRLFKINPAKTLQLAQSLYLASLISYPRTSSQKIPESIKPREILKKLAKNFPQVKEAIRDKPIEGKKSDPAHPSIFPTGEVGDMNGDESKIYSLVVKRFIACFCEDAEIESKKITFLCENKKFIASGIQILKNGWMKVYPLAMQETAIEDIEGEKIVEKKRIEEKTTQPPRRYSPASIITELEKRNLGTKCLTEDTKIILDGTKIEIKELFNNGKIYSNKNGLEIRQISGKTISLNKENNPLISEPNLISRRKLKENERIIKIETDFSDIKLTDDHIVYINTNEGIQEIQAKNLKINDKLVAIPKNFNEGEIIINNSFFKSGFKIERDEILNRFSAKKNSGIKISKLPIRWSSSLAWILGYFYGDGSYSDKKYTGSHRICFTTTEKKALNLLKQNIKQIFGTEPYCYDLNGKYKIDCNGVIGYALINAFPNIHGKKPFQIPKKFIGDFLRGFCDADGNVHLRPLGKTKMFGMECNSFDTPRIKFTLGNKEQINWISSLFKEVGIDNHINKNYALCRGKRFDCWTIFISGRDKIEKYAYEVGFDTYKEDILYKGLNCNSPKYKVLINSAKIYSLLENRELNPEEISTEIGISRYLTMRAIKHLFKLSLLSKRRIGNRSKQKWVYSIKKINKDYQLYCIKLLYKKIAKDLYEIPIKSISEVNYKGKVYDISVYKESPNFVVDGNILVHNSTRSSIIETLYNRKYIEGESIQATPLGISLISTLKKHSPIIIEEELTRNFEKEMNEIQKAKKGLKEKQEKILKDAKKSITDIANDFKKKEEKIGKELIKANKENYERERENNTLNLCEKCKKGKLRILFNRKSFRYFVACNSYPECKNTYSLPPNALIKPSGKTCECGFPKLLAIRKAKRPWEFCFNPECKFQNHQNEGNKQDKPVEKEEKAEK